MTETNIILTHNQIIQKIRRIAFEVYEHNFDSEEIVFAGIVGTGYKFAQLLEEQFRQVSGMKTSLLKVTIDKKAPVQTFIELDCELDALEKKVVILVDDVQNTGRTLAYSLKPFMNVRLQKLQVAVLVDRSYRKFPVSPDFIGYELSTTVNEHIDVNLEQDNAYQVTLT
ncbi:phosphoribosyltransferase family protein [Algivirga pacifica]|uniref:Bifunctional pyrimidine operon transcriptional regulator/uracil phosphoribosyltransferase n=1 Tax=Algivirga pacifica TaxID=1162670 RepID=A0ABP9D9M9_9BACT